MLNLSNQKKILFSKDYKPQIRIKSSKHFPSSTREWKNSIYLFNKNNLNLIPSADLHTIDIIKAYFSSFNLILEKKTNKNLLTERQRIISTHDIYVSNGEFKHTNDKIIINLYVYNKQLMNYDILIKSLKKILIFNLSLISSNLKNKLPFQNELRKIAGYKYLKEMLNLNKSKSTYFYLQDLKNQIYDIYNKDIVFNLINLKKVFLNSDIISEIVTTRIWNNRRKINKHIKKAKDIVKLNKILFIDYTKIVNKQLNIQYLANNNKDLIEKIQQDLKYKYVTGFKLEAKGRLSKRNKASRSVLKLALKGNLYNIDSSKKGLSSVLLKGNLNSNMQCTKLASESGIGSFGIRGWIGSN